MTARTLSAPASYVRRAAVVAAATGAVLLATAGPSTAGVPVGWSDPDDMSVLHLLFLILGAPLLLAAVITVLALLPSMIRGDGRSSGGTDAPDQWLGGPRQGTAELAGPDAEGTEVGGASARW